MNYAKFYHTFGPHFNEEQLELIRMCLLNMREEDEE